ncbi:succinylglutamate desuccinylase/aspartoacylase family protein [Microvirga alba]|uniref:Succinylglutamate desuccinylase/aspartoacylase family protein n=1 Tax=Microvirga alba TaxID=2791025 RepID=A0A931BV92_9HYPH|nr:succinylglutamate desuccinylase/aspartoacylase family protein [Microvirga alba]MBF9235353.1 succinylglutamate desuccinylase/aspartoacylase family protein [Microvirga alba]
MSTISRVWTAIDFNKIGRQSDFLRLPYSSNMSAYGWIPTPLICIKNGTGPTILLTAGNHGDEYEGQIALIKLAQDIDPAEVNGRIIILPALNYPAVAAGQRVSPIDDGNLNRLFPGNANGSPTDMLAHYIDDVLFPITDVVIDLHSGGRSLEYLPLALARPGLTPEHRQAVRKLLNVFGAPIGVLTDGGGGGGATTLYAAAEQRGIPALTTELGGGATLSPEGLAIAERGVRRVLKHYGVVPEMKVEASSGCRLMESLSRDSAVYSPENGLFQPAAEVGEMVSEGQEAGRIYFYDDPMRPPIILNFTAPGMVSCRRFPTITARGDCLYNLMSDIR